MAKFVEKKNLKLLKTANNVNRNTADGILFSDNGYVLTCCHGKNDGSLDLQINNGFSAVSPKTIKEEVNKRFNVNIKKKDILWICPCYPKQIRARYKTELRKII